MRGDARNVGPWFTEFAGVGYTGKLRRKVAPWTLISGAHPHGWHEHHSIEPSAFYLERIDERQVGLKRVGGDGGGPFLNSFNRPTLLIFRFFLVCWLFNLPNCGFKQLELSDEKQKQLKFRSFMFVPSSIQLILAKSAPEEIDGGDLVHSIIFRAGSLQVPPRSKLHRFD